MWEKFIHNSYSWILLLTISVVWTFLLYFRVITFDFVAWDDNAYVYLNNDIRELTTASVSKFFSGFYLGMYQPITMLSFAIDQYLFGLNPTAFHLINLMFHLFNVCLVFFFIRKLTADTLLSFVISLFFGIHPLHVESVAWISEKKDVLYSFFYLTGLIIYLQFLKTRKSRFWIFSMLLFILSLLSKSAGVTFSLALLLLHFYRERESFSIMKTIKTVWPFFLLSIIFGLISFMSQKSFDSPDISQPDYFFFNRIVIACFAYVSYITHLVFPTVFSVVHPLPMQTGSLLPALYYIYFLITLVIGLSVIYYFLKGTKNKLYFDILFGILFFTFLISIILYNPASKAVYADRYTYLPYIGLFFLISLWMKHLISNAGKYRKYLRGIAIVLFSVFSIFYSIKAYSFISNWENSSTLWIKTAENEPSAIAFFSRAIVKKDLGDIKGAKGDYKTAISINEHFYQAYTNIAAIAIEESDYSEALIYLNKVISLNPSFHEGYYNRGLVFGKLNRIPESIIEYNTAISINPNYAIAYYSRANAYASMNRFDEALKDVNISIYLDPTDYSALALRGYLLYKFNKIQDALNDLEKSIKLKPDYLLAYNNRSLIYRFMRDYNKALRDINFVLNKEPEFYQGRLNRARIYLDLNLIDKACIDLKVANKGGITEAGKLIEENCRQ